MSSEFRERVVSSVALMLIGFIALCFGYYIWCYGLIAPTGPGLHKTLAPVENSNSTVFDGLIITVLFLGGIIGVIFSARCLWEVIQERRG